MAVTVPVEVCLRRSGPLFYSLYDAHDSHNAELKANARVFGKPYNGSNTLYSNNYIFLCFFIHMTISKLVRPRLPTET